MRQAALLLALLPAAAAQTADELLRSARDLARAGCTMKLPKGEVNHGGHRRMQLGLGGLSSSTCELATLQNQAAAVDAAISKLNYGSVAINHWPAVVYGLVTTTWGGAPGHTIYDVGSGIGVVQALA